MISLVLLMAGISLPSAHAFLGSGDTKVYQSYGCLSLDGIPIPSSGDLFKTCCSGGHLVADPPSSCRVFTSIGDDAAEHATGGFQIAENALNTARNLDGVDSGFSASGEDGGTTGGSGSGTQPDTAAIQSGTGGLDPTGSGTDLGALDFGGGSNDGSSGGSGSGGASAGGAGGGDGLSVGSLSGSGDDAASKNGASTSGAANGDDSRLAYVGGGADGANGKGYGAGGSAGMDKSLKDLKFGDQNGRDPNAMADDEAQGTAEDPADYFSRIDRSADLFKIVSARYMKKKSLFLIKQ